MEISSATLQAREVALNKASVNRDQEQRAMEEQDKAEQTKLEETVAEVRKVDSDRQGRIDMYA